MTIDPEDMTPEDVLAYIATDEYRRKAAAMRARLAAGELMTMEQCAAALGVPYLYLAASIALKHIEAHPDGSVEITDEPTVVN